MGGVTYQRLLSQRSQSQRPRGGGGATGGGVRARAWVLLRWAAVRLSCAARRRYWCGGAGRARRLAWAGLCARGAAAAAAPERKGGGRRGAAVGAGAGPAVGYDSVSYARNFDDGAWKAEEGVSWAGPGGGGAFLPRACIGGAAEHTEAVCASAAELRSQQESVHPLRQFACQPGSANLRVQDLSILSHSPLDPPAGPVVVEAQAMATDTILETIKPRRSEDEQLPVTTPGAAGGTKAAAGGGIGLRRRMSSFSVHVRPPPALSLPSSVAAFRRARSMPSVKALAAAGALRRWWEWGLGWVTAPFAPRGPELGDDDDEARPLGGCRCAGGAAGAGGWRHVLFRLRAGARRLLGRDGRPLKAAAPQDFRYDSVSYAQNFDDGEA